MLEVSHRKATECSNWSLMHCSGRFLKDSNVESNVDSDSPAHALVCVGEGSENSYLHLS